MSTYLPGFDGATGWLNSPPLAPDDLAGKVVLADFWTYTCVNWLRTLPYVRAWAERYADDGLVVVGVHTPEFPFEQDVDNVTRAVRDMRIGYPVALDSDYGVWQAFDNHYWPAVYIADRDGRIQYHHFGEGAYAETERVIQRLLGVDGDTVSVAEQGVEVQADWEHLESPETYLGSSQAQRFARPPLGLNEWSLDGDWDVESRAAVLGSAPGSITYRFHARDVNLVLRSSDGEVPFRVTVDGAAPGAAHGADVDEQGRGTVSEPRLYQLVREPGQVVDRTFEIAFDAPGVEGYVFTFG
jgi:thiol-disulfide isomerase/thioredoxin